MIDIRLAPMAGITDWILRTLCFEQGCDCAYTEMVSALGFVYAPRNHLPTQSLLIRADGEKKLILQLFGKEPELIGKAAAELTAYDRFDGIDINMGCPAHKVASSGEGSGLMRNPALAREMILAVKRNTRLPVSVKMRLGWDDKSVNVVDMAKMAEDCGVSEITVHGRTRMQQYSGTADWEKIAEVKRAVSVPVIGNGDIFTAEDGLRKFRDSGVDGLMIGRGAMGNPWIFRQLKQLEAGEAPEKPDLHTRIDTAIRHYRMMMDWKPGKVAVNEMRKHIGWYVHGYRGAARMRDEINQMDSPEAVFDALRRFEAENGEEG